MNRLLSFFKKIRIGQILTVFIAGVALFLTTACNSGNSLGARPDNPPVQMGGNNNPHSMGGDGYTEYKMSTDPSVNKPTADQDQAALFSFGQLLAANTPAQSDDNAQTLLYPGADAPQSTRPGVGQVDPKVFEQQATEIPAQRQPVLDRSDPDLNILEKTGQAIKDSSAFLRDYQDQASEEANKYEQSRRSK